MNLILPKFNFRTKILISISILLQTFFAYSAPGFGSLITNNENDLKNWYFDHSMYKKVENTLETQKNILLTNWVETNISNLTKCMKEKEPHCRFVVNDKYPILDKFVEAKFYENLDQQLKSFKTNISKWIEENQRALTTCVTQKMNGCQLSPYPVESVNAPDEVRTEGKKVLSIWTPSIAREDKIEVIIENNYKSAYEKKSALVNKFTLEGNQIEQILAIINLDELIVCQKRKYKSCELSNSLLRGSAFVVNDNHLITVNHNFTTEDENGLNQKFQELGENWLSQLKSKKMQPFVAESIKKFEEYPFQDAIFVLTNYKNELVFNSIEENFKFEKFHNQINPKGIVNLTGCTSNLVGCTSLNPKFLDEQFKMSELFSVLAYINKDILVIKLPKNLPSLSIANDGCNFNDPAFNVGYPSESLYRFSIGRRDSVDMELSVTAGNFLDNDGALNRAIEWDAFDRFKQDLSSELGKNILSNDADLEKGMSGGPVLNKKGEVCGMMGHAAPKNTETLLDFKVIDKIYLRISLGINIQSILSGISEN